VAGRRGHGFGDIFGQLIRPVLMQQLVQPVAIVRSIIVEQRLVNQVAQMPQRCAGHIGGGLASEAAAKDRKLPKDQLLDRIQVLPRSIKDGPHAAVACRQIAKIAGQKSRFCCISSAISARDIIPTQPAESSMPKGMPSTSWQMRAAWGRSSGKRKGRRRALGALIEEADGRVSHCLFRVRVDRIELRPTHRWDRLAHPASASVRER
jgi:hypothetical protein